MDAISHDDLYFRALGPVSAELRGQQIELGGPQHTVVLAVLLANVNRVVPVDRLVSALWTGDPPRSYRVQVQGLVSALRQRLTPTGQRSAAPIVTRAPGYLIELPPHGFDLAEFLADAASARQARASGEDATAVRLLRTALARWRGPAFAGVESREVVDAAAAVEEARLVAVEECIDAQLADGQLAGLSAELVRLVTEYPLHECFVGQLMTAYARTGRPADALVAYRELRRRLVTELGMEPSADLQELHRQILAAGAKVAVQSVEHVPGRVSASACRQLPPDIANFIGRGSELAAILDASPPDPGTPVIVVLEGMAGVGKTTLAVRAAHQLTRAGRYGDGQFFVDLRGFSPAGDAADPAAVLEAFLRLLGIPAQRIPADLESRAAVFRDRVVGQHMLFVLDNAADEEQVRPLLPGCGTCMVVVTSRRSLAVDGARSWEVLPLRDDEAVDLLASVIGTDRVNREPQTSRALAARCGHLPLAVALAAQRLRTRPTWSIATLVARLADDDHLLDWLALGRRSADSLFALSYRTLATDRQQIFRMLGVHPGDDATAASCAALTGRDPVQVELALESLVDEHLLHQRVPGRYQMHGLLRAHAVRRCRTEDDVAERRAAMGRLLDWYVSATDAANRLIRRFGVPLTVAEFRSPVPVPPVATAAEAMAWLDSEYGNVMASVRVAVAGNWHAQVIRLAHLLQRYFVRRNRFDDWVATFELAVASARSLGDRSALAYSLLGLGQAVGSAGEPARAVESLREGLDLHRQLGDRAGEADGLDYLGVVHRRTGRYAEAARDHRQALDLLAELAERADPAREAMVHSNYSVDLHLLDRNAEALVHARRALEIQQSLDDPGGEASIRTNLGLLCARLGQHAEATRHSAIALALHREMGSRPGEAHALANLSLSHARLGEHDQAIEKGENAVELARTIGNLLIEAHARNTLGEAYRLAADRAAASRQFRAALTIASRIDDADELTRARSGLASVAGSS
jgi:DNA-binding SARP family transcriptional activator/tetratricopeptide (TPR) repeat protein